MFLNIREFVYHILIQWLCLQTKAPKTWSFFYLVRMSRRRRGRRVGTGLWSTSQHIRCVYNFLRAFLSLFIYSFSINILWFSKNPPPQKKTNKKKTTFNLKEGSEAYIKNVSKFPITEKKYLHSFFFLVCLLIWIFL